MTSDNMNRQKSRQRPRFRLGIDTLEERLVPAGIVAVGSEPHNPPRVQIFDAQTQDLKFDFNAFASNYFGGVNVAVGDVNGDGTPDFVASVASQGKPQVKVYDGLTGNPLPGTLGDFLAFDAGYRGGVNVATGDVNGDGFADIIVGAGPGAPPLVKVFSGANGSVLANFMAFDKNFKGGVRVAAGDFRHRLAADIVVATGPGSVPQVKVFAGDTQKVLTSYLAFQSKYRGGLFIGTGDIDHDGTIDVIAGSGRLGNGAVKVFSGMTNRLVTEFAASTSNYQGNVRVDAVDGNGDGFEDILIGLDSAAGPEVKIFDGSSHQLAQNYSPLTSKFSGAVSVAGSVPRGRGTNYELTAPVTHEIPVLERLAQYVPIDADHPQGQYLSVTEGSIDGSKNVYVITHGWAPGYRDWVNKYIDTHALKWWETAGYNNTDYPAPSPSPGADSIWMFDGYSESGVPISPPGGLAEEITKADPNAIVLAYSWIDDSATTAAVNNAIPQQAYLSEALTNINGLRMAEAIREALGANFNGKLHLMGHSHGTKVATLAAVSLEQSAGIKASQLTVFDSPEIAATDDLNASNFLWNYLQQLPISKQPNQGLFVDNYYSAFGVNYANMKISNQKLLNKVVDTELYAFPYSQTYLTDPGDWHAYAPAWYAQAHHQPSGSGTNGGLAWSPLLGFDTSTLASEWEQAWTRFNYSAANQAQLTNPYFTVTPGVTFAPLTIQNTNVNPPTPATTIQLGLGNGQTASFDGSYTKKTGWSGIAFDYVFTGNTRGILKIQINDYLAYYVDSQYVPAGVTQHVTMNIGWPTLSQSISIVLMPPDGVNSNAGVTLSNFRQFDVSLL